MENTGTNGPAMLNTGKKQSRQWARRMTKYKNKIS